MAHVIDKTLDQKYQDELPKLKVAAKLKQNKHPKQEKPVQKDSATHIAKEVPKAINAQKSVAKIVSSLKTKTNPVVAVKTLAKPVPLPFSKVVAAKLAVDDQKVANAVKQATKAASHLLKVAGKAITAQPAKADIKGAAPVSRVRQATAAHSGSPRPSSAASWRSAAAASLAATSRAAAPQTARLRAAEGRAPRRPSLAGEIQRALRAEMRSNRGDAGLARRMTREEEQSWDSELRKWGLAA